MNFDLGGPTTVDELDKICKDWAKARRCSRKNNCSGQDINGFYVVEGQECLDFDSCLIETCKIDMHFKDLVEGWIASNEFAVVENPQCGLPSARGGYEECQLPD